MKTHIFTPKMLVTTAVVSTMAFAGSKALKAQELAQSRLDNGVFTKVLNFDPNGTYTLKGTATTQAMTLDSAYLSQTIDVGSKAPFKFFGNLEVTVKSYENGVLTLQPTKAGHKDISLKNGDKIDEWTIEFDGSKLKASTTDKTVKQGDTLRGPAGSIDLVNAQSPPYTQAIVTSVPTITIQTDKGEVTLNNAIHVAFIRDSLATNNPVKNDFYAASGPLSEFVAEPSTKTAYYRDTGDAVVFKKNGTSTGFSGSNNTAFNAAVKSADGKPVIKHFMNTEDITYLRFATENGQITSQTFDLVRKGVTITDSVMQSGLLGYLNTVSNFRDTVTKDTNGKLQLEIIYNGNDPRNNAILKLGTPKDIVGVKDNPTQKINASVYPNPVTEVMTFKREEANSEAILVVRDLLGNTLFKQRLKAGENEAQIPMKDQAPGMYNVMVISTEARQLFYEKVIKE